MITSFHWPPKLEKNRNVNLLILCNEGGIGALKELSLLVESLSGVKIAKNKPVVGEENFARE